MASHFYAKEGKTQPPKYYTEGTLITAMKNVGRDAEDEENKAAAIDVKPAEVPACEYDLPDKYQCSKTQPRLKPLICPVRACRAPAPDQ